MKISFFLSPSFRFTMRLLLRRTLVLLFFFERVHRVHAKIVSYATNFKNEDNFF